jgi:hypothetical protein
MSTLDSALPPSGDRRTEGENMATTAVRCLRCDHPITEHPDGACTRCNCDLRAARDGTPTYLDALWLYGDHLATCKGREDGCDCGWSAVLAALPHGPTNASAHGCPNPHCREGRIVDTEVGCAVCSSPASAPPRATETGGTTEDVRNALNAGADAITDWNGESGVPLSPHVATLMRLADGTHRTHVVMPRALSTPSAARGGGEEETGHTAEDGR